MSRNTSVVLGDHFVDFVNAQIEEGRYGSTSDVIRAGLRLLEEREIALHALREALKEGEASGPATPLDLDSFLAAKRAGLTGG